MRKALVLLLALAPLAAQASPPHSVVELKPGDITFLRLYDVQVLTSVDPSVASAELAPAGELLITAKKAGTTDVVALSGGKLVGLRIHVRAPGTLLPDESVARLAAVEKACPAHRLLGEGAEAQLGATASPAACRAALVALFQTDRFLTKQISIDFDPVAIQVQLAEMEEAIKAAKVEGVELHYQGATLVLKGTVNREQAQRVIAALYTHAVGGVPLNDSDFEIEEPDAGAPPEAPKLETAPTVR